MAWQKFSDFLSKIKLGELAPIIAVYGSDRFLRKQAVAAVMARQGGGKKVEQEILYANESSPDQVLSALQTYSMFTPLKLVLVYQFQDFKAAQRTEVLAYLDNPNPSSKLILFGDPPAEYHDEKRFKDWFQKAAAKIEVVDVSGLGDKEMEALVKQLCKELDKRIAPEALTLLLEAVGSEPERIYMELEKMALYLGEAKTITPELVSDLVIGSRLQNLFELAEALGKKDLETSLGIFRKMLEQKQPREMALSIIKRHYRILLELAASLGSEQMQKQVMGRFRIPWSFQKQYLNQAERFSDRDLKKVFEEFYRSEVKIKSSSLEEEAVLERLILRLCRI